MMEWRKLFLCCHLCTLQLRRSFIIFCSTRIYGYR